MKELFLEVVKLSLSGSLFVLAVAALRLVFRKAPRWVFCLLWAAVALRLVAPVYVETRLSLVPPAVSQGQVVDDILDEYVEDVSIHYESSEFYQAAIEAGRKPVARPEGSYIVTEKGSLEAPATVGDTLVPILAWVWLAGLCLMLGYTVLSWLLLKRRVAAATVLRENIRESEQVDSPFVLGLFRPMIYLPYRMDPSDRENVIAHERAHIRRGDHWWKPLGFFLLSVYWFNPVLWIAYVLLCRDIEGACDEKVIGAMSKEEVRAYSRALLNCSVHRRRIAACPLAFGEVGVKERIKSVMHYKKPAFWIVLAAVLASVLAAVLLLTSPVSGETELMGAYYQLDTLLYTNKQEETALFNRYCITADFRLLGQQSGDTWLLGDALEEISLTDEELAAFTDYSEGWHEDKPAPLAEAYRMKAPFDSFYLVLKTQKGETLLGYGKEDAEGTQLRYLYRLASEYIPGEVDLEYLSRSLFGTVGVNQCFDPFVSQDHPGFLVVGFLSGYAPMEEYSYTDMGYGVFWEGETGWRLLQTQVYEDAALSETGIWSCEDPAVLSLDGEATEPNAFDVILCCNEDLDKIQREYFQGGALLASVAAIPEGDPAMFLFPWDQYPEADRLEQVYLGTNGTEIRGKSDEERILFLVDEILAGNAVPADADVYEYLRIGKAQFDQLVSYGNKTVGILLHQLENAKEFGLRELLMAAVCADITQVGGMAGPGNWTTAQEWLDIYYGESEDVLGTGEDQIGSSFWLDGGLLGIDKVLVQILDIRDNPNRYNTQLHTYHFCYYGDGKQAGSGLATVLVTAEDFIYWETDDFDGDGIVELFLQVDDYEKPYRLYDLEGGSIVVREYELVPDEVIDYDLLIENDTMYLYQEQWAWFFKDPAAYIRELAKRPEDRLWFGCPTGRVPSEISDKVFREGYTAVHRLLDETLSDQEKRVAYHMLMELDFNCDPETAVDLSRVLEEAFNYGRLFEKWSRAREESGEETNCFEQMLVLFDQDSVALMKAMAKADWNAFSRGYDTIVHWLTDAEFYYDAGALEEDLKRMERNASTEAEKAVAEAFREAYGQMEAPPMDPGYLLGGDGDRLWKAFFFDTEGTVRALGKLDLNALNQVGQQLWGSYEPPQKNLEKCYEAVKRVLKKSLSETETKVGYELLVHVEFEGGFKDVYVPGESFDYERFFNKRSYTDAATTEYWGIQNEPVFRADPAGYMRALAAWEGAETRVEGILLDIAYDYYYKDSQWLTETVGALLETLKDPEALALTEQLMAKHQELMNGTA